MALGKPVAAGSIHKNAACMHPNSCQEMDQITILPSCGPSDQKTCVEAPETEPLPSLSCHP
eukprot:1323130-Amphidinium_carterae.1